MVCGCVARGDGVLYEVLADQMSYFRHVRMWRWEHSSGVRRSLSWRRVLRREGACYVDC